LIFYGFLGQLFSVGIILVIFYLTYYLAETGRFDYKTDILIVFFLTLNGLNYLEALAYPVIPAVAFSILVFFDRNYLNKKKALWKNVAFVAMVYSVLNFAVIARFIWLFSVLNVGANAWPMNFATFYDISGLKDALLLPANKLMIIYILVPNYIILSVLLHQLRKEKLFSLFSATFVSYLLLFVVFSLLYYRHGEQSTYKVFKAAVSMSFIVFILIIRFLEEYLNSFYESILRLRQNISWSNALHLGASLPREKGFVAALLFIVFFSLNIRGTYAGYLEPLSGERPMGISSEHEALKLFTDNPRYAGADFILNCDHSFHQMMAEYYSPLGRTFTSNYKSYAQRNMKESFEPGDFYVTDGTVREIYNVDAELLFINNIYSVFRLKKESILPADNAGIDQLAGFINTQQGRTIARRVTENEVSFLFISLIERTSDLSIVFFNSSEDAPNLSLGAFVNGKFVSKAALTKRFSTVDLKDITLSRGDNVISFTFDGDYSSMWMANLRFLNDRLIETADSPLKMPDEKPET
jgi:hypothetical protein